MEDPGRQCYPEPHDICHAAHLHAMQGRRSLAVQSQKLGTNGAWLRRTPQGIFHGLKSVEPKKIKITTTTTRSMVTIVSDPELVTAAGLLENCL